MTDQAATFADLLRARYSCRAYLDTPVPRADIDAALSEAQHVPSWCNSQPWQVIALSQPETQRFANALYDHVAEAKHQSDIPFPAAYEGIYKTRRSTCGWQLYDAVGIQRGDRAASGAQMRENFRLFGAPHFLLITTPQALGAYGALDCGAYVTAVCLALQARGIGSVPMASTAGFAPFVHDWFDIPEDRAVLCGIALGYPDPDAPVNSFRTDRAEPPEVVTWR
ncbi:nitroreductase [Tropicibacter naphthalenivorans]|uniref:Coenzyme F420:L-glutamate ligase n=1 Tax=Tropicibacter naphthalenivorans TaxID=441103 RepID=A0A0P1GSN4_9RHOB|nr:nitroreductase [Tropicibacter naphthalenivorans]CUH78170.1 Coenzyme F420:L-glutamate ligase [Tropicibacter naphthalenivorans]SMC93248.1 Nitroreductase [Tropicibacter naphthalenivorans]